MKFKVRKSSLSGSVNIPGSKSHTIRALSFALLADGESLIEYPLESSDTRSCLKMVSALGAAIEESGHCWKVTGRGGDILVPDNVIDVGNSGTSLYMGMGLGALAHGAVVFTGDSQIRGRPAQGLINSLNDLGAEVFSTRGSGRPPIVVKGPVSGGATSIEAVTSQYLTSLLISASFAKNDSEIDVPLLNELPYVTMTLSWMDRLGLTYKNNAYKSFTVAGRQSVKPFTVRIPADFSSAAFFFVAAAVTGSELVLDGLDYTDTQGDKKIVEILMAMGCGIEIGQSFIRIKGGSLKGGVFDLNSMPDALPALAVAGCFAKGETRLINVPQARLKETDRISVMCMELRKMGADIDEMPDGLIIRESVLKGSSVNGHSDHRVAMALAVAGAAAHGETEISTAESVSVTFPDFFDLMKSIGSEITKVE